MDGSQIGSPQIVFKAALFAAGMGFEDGLILLCS